MNTAGATIADRLVRLYPASFRERWGPALEEEARAAGWKAWPNLIAGIADMWLHPAIWPADCCAQRRQRAATMAVTAAAACWFVTHAVTELDAAAAEVARAWPMNASTLLLLLGLVLVAPRPRLTRPTATTLLRHAASRFTVPAVLGAGVVAAVHTGTYAVAPAVARPVLLACWWAALALGAVQCCRLVSSLCTTVAEPPPPGRLRHGLWTLAAAAAVPVPALLGASMSGDHLNVPSAASGAGLLLLSPALAATLRDLTPAT